MTQQFKTVLQLNRKKKGTNPDDKIKKNFQLGIQVTFSTNLDSAKFEHRGHRWPPFVAVKLIRRKRRRSSRSSRRRRSRERNAKGEASAISREKEWGSGEESGVSEWDGHNFFFFTEKKGSVCVENDLLISAKTPTIFSPVFISINDTWQANDPTVKKRKQVNKPASHRGPFVLNFKLKVMGFAVTALWLPLLLLLSLSLSLSQCVQWDWKIRGLWHWWP